MKNEFCVKLIKKYQENKQIIGSGHCKFYPTCSNYAIETYQKFNFFYASLLVGIRILRCNPFAKRRYYPVKLTKEEKRINKFIIELKNKYQTDFIDFCLSLNKDPNYSIEYFSQMVYNYINLPIHPIFNLDINKPLIFQSRFIIIKNKTNYQHNIVDNIDYNEILQVLYENKLIANLPIAVTNSFNPDYSLLPIDNLNIEDILNLLNINEGIILINNLNTSITYKGFEVINVDNKSIKDHLDKHNVILFGKDINIFNYLDRFTFSINLYSDILEYNQFYHLNKKR